LLREIKVVRVLVFGCFNVGDVESDVVGCCFVVPELELESDGSKVNFNRRGGKVLEINVLRRNVWEIVREVVADCPRCAQ
jgi:hypothetical protein